MRIRSLGLLVVVMLLLLPLQVLTPTREQPSIDRARLDTGGGADSMDSPEEVLEFPAVQHARDLFRQLDVNGDGQLDAGEMPTALRAQLSRWDANKDGTIDAAEFLLYFSARVQQARAAAQDSIRPRQISRITPPLLPAGFAEKAEIIEEQDQQDHPASTLFPGSIQDKVLAGLDEWVAAGLPASDFWEVVDLIPDLFFPDKMSPPASLREDTGSTLSAPVGSNAGGKETQARNTDSPRNPDEWEAYHVGAAAGLPQKRGQAAPLARQGSALAQVGATLAPPPPVQDESSPASSDADELDALATVPLPLDDGTNLAWTLRNEQNMEMLMDGPANVVFLGDSITDYLATGTAQPVWQTSFAPLGAINLGVRGATTSQVLWQVETGQVAAANPDVVVLMIGINNLGIGQTPDATAAGIAKIVQQISEQLPQTRILLLGLLPVGESPNPLRDGVADVNSLIANLASERVYYQDVGEWFMEPNGTISSTILVDYIHPSVLGYELYAGLIVPTIQDLLSTQPAKPGRTTSASKPASQTMDGTAGS